MSKQKEKQSNRTGNSGRIVKARYDENSKFAAFDVVEISHDGQQSKSSAVECSKASIQNNSQLY